MNKAVFAGPMVAALFFALDAGAVRSETAQPAVLANTCFSCHGTGGNSVGAMPTIAGKSPQYIVQTLKDFRSDKKQATVMNRIAKGFTDAEIEALGRYFSAR